MSESRKTGLWQVSLFVLFGILSVSQVLAEETGTIQGRVFSREGKSARPLPRAMVQLAVYKSDFQIAGARTRTDARGRYEFKDLSTGTEFAYQVTVRPSNVPFKSAPLWFREKKTVDVADITVAPTTGRPDRVETEALIVVESDKKGLLNISHSFTFTNRGNTVYDPHGEGGVPIEVSLPEGGFDLSLGAGLDSDSAEVLPGKNSLALKVQVPADPKTPHRAEYAYRMAYQTRVLPLSFRASIPLSRVSLVLVNRPADVGSDFFKFEESYKNEGKRYDLYSEGPLKAGQTLAFTLKGLPLPGDTGRIALFAGMAAAVLVALFQGLKRPKGKTDCAT